MPCVITSYSIHYTKLYDRRIEKYELYDVLPHDIKEYALASLLKRAKELKEYPEYSHLKTYQERAIKLEEEYLASKGIKIENQAGKTILCQIMDIPKKYEKS